jgi:hypothetical protein
MSAPSNWLPRIFFTVGLMSLCFLLGAAVMFFRLPLSGFLTRAFEGSEAWQERGLDGRQPAATPPLALTPVDKPDKTLDGYTLCTFASHHREDHHAYLFNMRGKAVHQWAMPFNKVWPEPEHVRAPVQDAHVNFFGTQLLPNGDLLVTYYSQSDWAYGYGLIKLDKDSNLLWSYPARVHHDIAVAEDGTIYGVQQEIIYEMPPGLQRIPTPCLVDYLVRLSVDGKVLGEPLSLLQAFRDSPYAPLLTALEEPGHDLPAGMTLTEAVDDSHKHDVHTNSVQVLSQRLAACFPRFQAGQVLVSIRNMDTLAVVDLECHRVVWAVQGPWRRQHDAQFLDNGHLLLFDNHGSPLGSRVLEYNLETQGFPWFYVGENSTPFYTDNRGQCQRLPNGNTLVVNSRQSEIREVTPDKELVWSCSFDSFIHTARRFSPDQVPFLKGDVHVR